MHARELETDEERGWGVFGCTHVTLYPLYAKGTDYRGRVDRDDADDATSIFRLTLEILLLFARQKTEIDTGTVVSTENRYAGLINTISVG